MGAFSSKTKEAAARAEFDKLAKVCFARVHEHTRRLDTKPYHCDWCAANITQSDDNTFWCQNDDCHKVVCGREGCSSQLANYVCEECST